MKFNLQRKKKYQYVQEGEGKPLVLLHGLMGELSNFDDLTEYFSQKGYCVYIPQLPIYNLPILNTNVGNIAKFVYEFLNEVVGEPSVLIGNSLGGHVGLVVTHKYPAVVEGLVLTGSSGLFEK